MRTCTLPTAFAESVAALSQRRGFSESLACTKKPRPGFTPAGLLILCAGNAKSNRRGVFLGAPNPLRT